MANQNNAEDIKEEIIEENNEEVKNEETNAAQEEPVETVEEDAEALQAKLAEQQAQLENLAKEKEELNSRYLRAQADFENFKRRSNEEKIQARKFRSQDLVTEVLPVIDNFQRALSVQAESADAENLKQGMEMVLRQLQEALKKEGVEEIEAANQPFDPNLHQAVMQVESSEHESNTVVEVLQAGYTLNGRVVRPAMVKVSS
ncbi:nucleotide exchange factor GrpE [Terrilactibacillus sp. BCM23-1]|uniref:Protein GrpE n=1 Tax=Terrilactibacillus tamarindi TaxID=2599694 RepID=A0A6N8CR27_9BACI|nr:nucleotide exchange factor GrpE [Terrilactibacillus tamarindi]MTT32501.1 nucleotide exchange factor GrpE [Terrilactibacillus tamarindi]